MAQLDILTILQSEDKDPLEFEYDLLTCPPIYHYLSIYDINELKNISSSISLSSKTEEKYRLIKDIMTRRGFARFAGGTNRVVYRNYEDPKIVAKIAMDKIGREANLSEYVTQNFIKPYCAKTFYVTPCGTVALAERVLPISNKLEYLSVARYVFRVITNIIIGKYVADDIGCDYFLNVGIRNGFGVVFLDYPYIYPLNGNRLYCNKVLEDGNYCNGEIDYDSGFNELYCTKCGKRYFARDLRKNIFENMPIIKKGGFSNMKVNLMRGNEVVFSPVKKSNYIVKNDGRRARVITKEKDLASKVILSRGNEVIKFNDTENIEKLNEIEKNVENAEEIVKETGKPVVTATQMPKDSSLTIDDTVGFKETVTIVHHYDNDEQNNEKNDEQVEQSSSSISHEKQPFSEDTGKYKGMRDIRTNSRQLEPAVRSNFNNHSN